MEKNKELGKVITLKELALEGWNIIKVKDI